jgi:hypothetical protein
MASRRFRLTLATATAVALLSTHAAWGDATAADRETARSLMQEGRGLRDQGDVKGALKKFQSANEIMHVPTTYLEVAQTQVALGQLIAARDTIAELRKAGAQGNEPDAFKRARDKADELDAGLEVRIPSLTVVVSGGPEGVTPSLTIDGAQVPQAAATVPRKVDPGHHVVVAKAGGGEGTKEVDLGEGEQKQVEVVLSSGSTGGGGEGEETPKEQAPEGAVSDNTSHGPTAVTWAGIGVGGAGIIVGAITGLMSMSKTSSLQNECPGKRCTSQGAVNDLNSANSLATISTVGFVVGGVGGGVALASILMGHSAEPAPKPATTDQSEPEARPASEPETSLRVSPWIGLGSAGVSGSF